MEENNAWEQNFPKQECNLTFNFQEVVRLKLLYAVSTFIINYIVTIAPFLHSQRERERERERECKTDQ